MECPDFLAAFQKDLGFKGDHTITTLEYSSAGDLIVTSGSLLACDPYYCCNEQPFLEQILPSHYPTILCIAHFQNSDQRVAFAAVHFSENIPVSWKVAIRSGDNDLTGFSYCVDSGTGCFMDRDAISWIIDIEGIDCAFFEDQMSYRPTWGWVNVPAPSHHRANVIAFSSGWGDGGYHSFFGYDATNQPVCLVTDCGVLERA